MPDYLGSDQRKAGGNTETKEKKDFIAIDTVDAEIIQAYRQAPYRDEVKKSEEEIQKLAKDIVVQMGHQDSDTGLAHPSMWDLQVDKVAAMFEKPLQVARVTKKIPCSDGVDRYMVHLKQNSKFIVELADKLNPEDIKEGDRVGVEKGTYQIQLVLPPKIDPTVSVMEVEDKPDVTYNDIGGQNEMLLQLREVVELPLLYPEKLIRLGIDPPKGVLLFGPPGTGKTLCARAVANRTDAAFICVIASQLVQKYVGEGARLVREIFEMARTKKAAIIFFDEIDAIGGTRFDDGAGGDSEVQRTMLELITQLDGFDNRGNIKVLMATNRPDTLDPALVRPGRIDRKIEFGLPDNTGRTQIFKIAAKSMNVAKDIRFELLSRLCPMATGAEIRSVATEAGMIAIRQKRKTATEADFLKALNKVVKGYAKFSATARYLTHN